MYTSILIFYNFESTTMRLCYCINYCAHLRRDAFSITYSPQPSDPTSLLNMLFWFFFLLLLLQHIKNTTATTRVFPIDFLFRFILHSSVSSEPEQKKKKEPIDVMITSSSLTLIRPQHDEGKHESTIVLFHRRRRH